MSPWSQRETDLGTLFEAPGFKLFFGNRESSTDACRKQYPSLHFSRVRQVHKDQIVFTKPSDDLKIEADAQISSELNHALVVITADCVPLLIGDNRSGRMAGIHAGWRGVAARILPKTLSLLLQQGSRPQDLFLAIGPHLAAPSFEVQTDVRDLLVASSKTPPTACFGPHSTPGKWNVDLLAILKSQWLEFDVQDAPVLLHARDTKTTPEYHSFRRDRESAGRQVSWIARL